MSSKEKDEFWDPIAEEYIDTDQASYSHFVPVHVGYDLAALIFGRHESEGFEIIYDT